jgi:protein-L-isoaspartate O-methyltransferase
MLEALLLAAAVGAFALPISLPWQLILCAALALPALPGISALAGGAPFVPTGGSTFRRMMALANVQRGKRVYDLGCGDGRFVVAAARMGARATGYELSLPLSVIAKIRCLFFKNCSIRMADLWSQDYRDADVIFCFQTKAMMHRVGTIIWPQLKPGARLVSHAFVLPGIKETRRDRMAILYIKT